jgi:Subtilase family
MSRTLPATVCALAACALAPAVAGAAPWDKPRDPATPATARTLAVEGSFGRTVPGRQRLLVTFADRPRAVAARARLAGIGNPVAVLPEAGVWGLEPARPLAARAQALGREGVVSAEWSLARSDGARSRPKRPTALPDVPGFQDPLHTPSLQWGLLGGPTWSSRLTGLDPRPRIAVLDSGVDPTHEEWAGAGTPLVAPRSTVTDSPDADDWAESGHGTHVAGVAAAPANGVGVVGVAPAEPSAAQVIPVQVADPNGLSTDDTIIRGIRWAVRHGARVISISSGGSGFSRAFQDTILWATQRGAVVVASVGNEGEGLNTLNYPAAYRRVIGVGALCDSRRSTSCPRPFHVARFSNFNRSVDVLAPGVNVLSSVPTRVRDRQIAPGYGLKDGTSMATPYVAGVLALVQASNGNGLSPYQLAEQLARTSTDIGRRGYDHRTGHGIVDPQLAVTTRAPADDTAEVNDDVKWLDGEARRGERARRRVIEATLDRFDDPEDVYPVLLRRGERLGVTLRHGRGRLALYVWRPGTRTVATAGGNAARNLVRYTGRAGVKGVAFRASRSGRYFLNVFARAGASEYRLTTRRS